MLINVHAWKRLYNVEYNYSKIHGVKFTLLEIIKYYNKNHCKQQINPWKRNEVEMYWLIIFKILPSIFIFVLRRVSLKINNYLFNPKLLTARYTQYCHVHGNKISMVISIFHYNEMPMVNTITILSSAFPVWRFA